jgi:ion channel POLLUX/CASTOR
MDTLIHPGDQLVLVTEDDSSAHLSGIKTIPMQPHLIRQGAPAVAIPEATIILGWNKRGATIIRELDKFVAPGSRIMVITNNLEPEAEVTGLISLLRNQTLAFKVGNIADRRLLENMALETYNHVIVLADLDGVSLQVADARTLITLLHLRDINEKNGHPFSIVSEMLDVRNRKLAEVTRVDDFIVSDELASLLMTQIAEDKELSLVFEDLFYPEGSEIFLRPMSNYVALGQPVSFYTVIESARQRGEVALGYRIAADAASLEKKFGVAVNPHKTAPVVFQKGDKVVVVAQI